MIFAIIQKATQTILQSENREFKPWPSCAQASQHKLGTISRKTLSLVIIIASLFLIYGLETSLATVISYKRDM